MSPIRALVQHRHNLLRQRLQEIEKEEEEAARSRRRRRREQGAGEGEEEEETEEECPTDGDGEAGSVYIRDARLRRVKKCRDLLFLGFRSECSDFLFSSEWKGLYSDWLDVHVAFSREESKWRDFSREKKKHKAKGKEGDEEDNSTLRHIRERKKVYVQDLLEQKARQVSRAKETEGEGKKERGRRAKRQNERADHSSLRSFALKLDLHLPQYIRANIHVFKHV